MKGIEVIWGVREIPSPLGLKVGHRVDEAGSGDEGCEGGRTAEDSVGERRRESGLELREPSKTETSAQKERKEEEEEGACSDKELDELLDC